MGAISMNTVNGTSVVSAEQMLGNFIGELTPLLQPWTKRLQGKPDDLMAIEQEIQAVFQRGAGMLTAGIVGATIGSDEFLQAAEATRTGFAYPLAQGRKRSVKIRLLGGFVMWVASLYCEPGKGLFRKRNEDASGLYIELAQFGFAKGVTPAVESQVARQVALCPSMKLAKEELSRGGLTLDIKAVRRISLQCGDGLLKLRTYQLLQWRAGELPATDEFKGKRITVQIDGGRTRLRSELKESKATAEPVDEDGLPVSDVPGRSRQRPKRTFDATWREPKLVTIFEHDEQGRMVKQCKATIDGTFEGPDAIAELVALHLHRLGGAGALSVTFVADGAPWIWERIAMIVQLAKLPESVKIYEVLDCCHAVHHVSSCLATYGSTASERLPLYRDLRTKTRNGQWREVVELLTDLADDTKNDTMRVDIAYLEKHGQAGRMSYPHFRKLGIPGGSGAIESGIRQVINMRLKGNSIFWREENAESVLQLRSLAITDRWDERMNQKREYERHSQLSDWHWTPRTPTKLEALPATPPKPHKSLEKC